MQATRFQLNSGGSIPAIGLGTWKSPKGVVGKAVDEALDVGYRHIDCAAIYGNESEVGEVLARRIGSGDGRIAREEVFVTSKLWNDRHRAEDVEPSCRESISRLGLEFLDLFLIHWPYSLRRNYVSPWTVADMDGVPMEETWRAMEALVAKKLVRAIGVCNVSERRLSEILSFSRDVQPSVVQCELHPYLPQPGLLSLCASRGIHVTAYSALGSGDRPNRSSSDPVLLQDPVLANIAEAHPGTTAAQVAIKWGVQRGTSVLAKSTTPSRIRENFASLQLELSALEMSQIVSLGNRKLRYIAHTGTTDAAHVPPGHVQWLWD